MLRWYAALLATSTPLIVVHPVDFLPSEKPFKFFSVGALSSRNTLTLKLTPFPCDLGHKSPSLKHVSFFVDEKVSTLVELHRATYLFSQSAVQRKMDLSIRPFMYRCKIAGSQFNHIKLVTCIEKVGLLPLFPHPLHWKLSSSRTRFCRSKVWQRSFQPMHLGVNSPNHVLAHVQL